MGRALLQAALLSASRHFLACSPALASAGCGRVNIASAFLPKNTDRALPGTPSHPCIDHCPILPLPGLSHLLQNDYSQNAPFFCLPTRLNIDLPQSKCCPAPIHSRHLTFLSTCGPHSLLNGGLVLVQPLPYASGGEDEWKAPPFVSLHESVGSSEGSCQRVQGRFLHFSAGRHLPEPTDSATPSSEPFSVHDVTPRPKKRRQNLVDILWKNQNWGVGATVAKRHWDAGTFYQITRVQIRKSGKAGVAWGIFHQNGTPVSAELRIGGVNKPCWKQLGGGSDVKGQDLNTRDLTEESMAPVSGTSTS